MRARLVAVLAAAACAAGCALLLGDDTFAGRYRVADPKDRTVIRISASFLGRWEMRYNDRDPYPDSELVAASRAELKRWFSGDAPLTDIDCLVAKGRQSHPVVCSVPKDVAIRLDPRATPRASKTGWILVAPTGNGLVFGDLVRER
jgi:hypothetical protein